MPTLNNELKDFLAQSKPQENISKLEEMKFYSSIQCDRSNYAQTIHALLNPEEVQKMNTNKYAHIDLENLLTLATTYPGDRDNFMAENIAFREAVKANNLVNCFISNTSEQEWDKLNKLQLAEGIEIPQKDIMLKTYPTETAHKKETKTNRALFLNKTLKDVPSKAIPLDINASALDSVYNSFKEAVLNNKAINNSGDYISENEILMIMQKIKSELPTELSNFDFETDLLSFLANLAKEDQFDAKSENILARIFYYYLNSAKQKLDNDLQKINTEIEKVKVAPADIENSIKIRASFLSKLNPLDDNMPFTHYRDLNNYLKDVQSQLKLTDDTNLIDKLNEQLELIEDFISKYKVIVEQKRQEQKNEDKKKQFINANKPKVELIKDKEARFKIYTELSTKDISEEKYIFTDKYSCYKCINEIKQQFNNPEADENDLKIEKEQFVNLVKKYDNEIENRVKEKNRLENEAQKITNDYYQNNFTANSIPQYSNVGRVYDSKYEKFYKTAYDVADKHTETEIVIREIKSSAVHKETGVIIAGELETVKIEDKDHIMVIANIRKMIDDLNDKIKLLTNEEVKNNFLIIIKKCEKSFTSNLLCKSDLLLREKSIKKIKLDMEKKVEDLERPNVESVIYDIKGKLKQWDNNSEILKNNLKNRLNKIEEFYKNDVNEISSNIAPIETATTEIVDNTESKTTSNIAPIETATTKSQNITNTIDKTKDDLTVPVSEAQLAQDMANLVVEEMPVEMEDKINHKVKQFLFNIENKAKKFFNFNTIKRVSEVELNIFSGMPLTMVFSYLVNNHSEEIRASKLVYNFVISIFGIFLNKDQQELDELNRQLISLNDESMAIGREMKKDEDIKISIEFKQNDLKRAQNTVAEIEAGILKVAPDVLEFHKEKIKKYEAQIKQYEQDIETWRDTLNFDKLAEDKKKKRAEIKILETYIANKQALYEQKYFQEVLIPSELEMGHEAVFLIEEANYKNDEIHRFNHFYNLNYIPSIPNFNKQFPNSKEIIKFIKPSKVHKLYNILKHGEVKTINVIADEYDDHIHNLTILFYNIRFKLSEVNNNSLINSTINDVFNFLTEIFDSIDFMANIFNKEGDLDKNKQVLRLALIDKMTELAKILLTNNLDIINIENHKKEIMQIKTELINLPNLFVKKVIPPEPGTNKSLRTTKKVILPTTTNTTKSQNITNTIDKTKDDLTVPVSEAQLAQDMANLVVEEMPVEMEDKINRKVKKFLFNIENKAKEFFNCNVIKYTKNELSIFSGIPLTMVFSYLVNKHSEEIRASKLVYNFVISIFGIFLNKDQQELDELNRQLISLNDESMAIGREMKKDEDIKISIEFKQNDLKRAQNTVAEIEAGILKVAPDVLEFHKEKIKKYEAQIKQYEQDIETWRDTLNFDKLAEAEKKKDKEIKILKTYIANKQALYEQKYFQEVLIPSELEVGHETVFPIEESNSIIHFYNFNYISNFPYFNKQFPDAKKIITSIKSSKMHKLYNLFKHGEANIVNVIAEEYDNHIHNLTILFHNIRFKLSEVNNNSLINRTINDVFNFLTEIFDSIDFYKNIFNKEGDLDKNKQVLRLALIDKMTELAKILLTNNLDIINIENHKKEITQIKTELKSLPNLFVK